MEVEVVVRPVSLSGSEEGDLMGWYMALVDTLGKSDVVRAAVDKELREWRAQLVRLIRAGEDVRVTLRLRVGVAPLGGAWVCLDAGFEAQDGVVAAVAATGLIDVKGDA